MYLQLIVLIVPNGEKLSYLYECVSSFHSTTGANVLYCLKKLKFLFLEFIEYKLRSRYIPQKLLDVIHLFKFPEHLISWFW